LNCEMENKRFESILDNRSGHIAERHARVSKYMEHAPRAFVQLGSIFVTSTCVCWDVCLCNVRDLFPCAGASQDSAGGCESESATGKYRPHFPDPHLPPRPSLKNTSFLTTVAHCDAHNRLTPFSWPNVVKCGATSIEIMTFKPKTKQLCRLRASPKPRRRPTDSPKRERVRAGTHTRVKHTLGPSGRVAGKGAPPGLWRKGAPPGLWRCGHKQQAPWEARKNASKSRWQFPSRTVGQNHSKWRVGHCRHHCLGLPTPTLRHGGDDSQPPDGSRARATGGTFSGRPQTNQGARGAQCNVEGPSGPSVRARESLNRPRGRYIASAAALMRCNSRQTSIAIAHENSSCLQVTASDCASKPCERGYDVKEGGHTRAGWASAGGI
jgi:hypothetical protein